MTNAACVTWKNQRVMLTLLLVFLCGFLAGGLLMRVGIGRYVKKQAPLAQVASKEFALGRLTKELDLSAEQRKRLELVLDDFVKYVQMLQVQMDEARADGKDRIMQLLNAEQKTKFERMLEQLQLQARHDERP